MLTRSPSLGRFFVFFGEISSPGIPGSLFGEILLPTVLLTSHFGEILFFETWQVCLSRFGEIILPLLWWPCETVSPSPYFGEILLLSGSHFEEILYKRGRRILPLWGDSFSTGRMMSAESLVGEILLPL